MSFLTEVRGQNTYRQYTSLDGLQHDVTYNIMQDSKGYIWIATDDGLSKFNGKDFKNYSSKDGLISNYVMDIEEVSEAKYAVTTWGGGVHFLENDSIYKNKNFNDANAKSYDIIYLNNKIYTNSGSGLLVYDLEKETFNSKIFINAKEGFIKELKPESSFVNLKPAVLNNKVYVHGNVKDNINYKGINEFDLAYKIKPSFSFLSDIEISTSLEINKDYYLFASGRNLLFTNKNKVIETVFISDIKTKEHIVKVIKPQNNSSDYGLLIRKPDGKKRFLMYDASMNKTYTIEELSALNIGVSDIMFDFENNLWISTFGNGVYCYYYSNPRVINFLTNEYFTAAVKKDSVVFAQTSSKLYKLKKNKIIATYSTNGFAKHLNLIDNQLFVSLLNPKSKSNPNFNVISGRFFEKTKYGNVRQSDTIFIDDKSVLVSNEIFIKLVDEGDSLINLYTNKGKWIYNFKDLKLIKDIKFEEGFPSVKINDLLVDKDVSYIATDKGLIIKNNKEDLKIFDSTSGLQNERINCLLVKDDMVFIGTQAGLSMIKDNKVYNFSKSFGVQSLSINKIILLDNDLWLIGNNGISILDINDIKISNGPKLIVKQHSNRFLYEVISFFDQNAIIIEYKINNNKWVALSSLKGELNLSNYAPNEYTIQFRTQNGRSNWVFSNFFKFEIKPPLYKVWWFILIVFLTIFGFFAIFFNRRVRVVSKRNKTLKNEIHKRITAENELSEVRDNIARDFHDDLGNKLASISLLSDVLSKKLESDQNKVVQTIKSDADYLYKGTRDFIFSLQEKSNYIEEIIIYLSDFAEDYLYQFGIDFEVKSTVDKNTKLPYYWSKQIIFIFKEAITNTVKYSEAKNANMFFCFKDNELEILFNDDGIGFEIDNVKQNGLYNMQARAEKIDCKVNLISELNKGTRVFFYGKLPH